MSIFQNRPKTKTREAGVVDTLIVEVKIFTSARYQWLTPVIIAIWKAELERTVIEGQPGKTVHKNPSPK
jgi:hypothetical protein